MAIRFAAARRKECALVARALTLPRLSEPANDDVVPLTRDRLLRKALWHFAEYGLAAAAQARVNAVSALSMGDPQEHHNWMAICRLLDRRLAIATYRH